jgi:hypothetical protein
MTQHSEYGAPPGTWWRFTSYEIVGHHIRPAQHAELRPYNPWLEYERHQAEGRGGGMHAPPYESLLYLAEIQSAQRAGWRIDRTLPMAEGPRLLDWCGEHGLLGLFFTEVRQLTLYPRWQVAREGNGNCEAVMQEHSYGGRWMTISHSHSSLETALLPTAEKPAGMLVAHQYWSKEWRRPGALLQTLDTGIYYTQPLRDLACYFPDVADPETYPYPRPASEEFWRVYAEDADQFLRLAFSFADAIRILAQAGGKQLAGDQLAEARQALEFLNRLAAGAEAGFSLRDNGAVESCWKTPSLIAAFARMALLDLARGWIQVCARCARVFISSAGKARFCSPRCRYAVQRRLWRAAAHDRAQREGLVPVGDTDRSIIAARPAVPDRTGERSGGEGDDSDAPGRNRS